VTAKAPVIMVHGAFCGGWAFEAFKAPFEAAGHRCLTPDLRPNGQAAGMSMGDYAASVAALIQAQDHPPILIGHSLGGLVAQMAAVRAAVGGLILLAPSAPWGVTGGSVEEAASAVSLYALGPYWLQAIEPDFTTASSYSLDRMSPDQRKAVFGRMTAESGRALWETLNWWMDPFLTTTVSPGRIAAPVLAVAGGQDRVHPSFTVKQTGERLGAELMVFPQMSHWLVAEPGWPEVAAACLKWIVRQAAVTAP